MSETAGAPDPSTPVRDIDNATIGAMLREAADLLAVQGANPFRVQAYRRGADQIASLGGSARELFEREGRAGLDAIPGIGAGLAGAISELLLTGRWRQLERLRGESDPSQVFQAVPGIGEALGHRIHDDLQVDTLEGLETAAFDGRLARVRGVGGRRARSIGAVLHQLLDRGRPRPSQAAGSAAGAGPSIEMLLAIDREYRDKATAKALPTIAPRRFNPTGEAWLPIWHTERGPWHFTVLYSNTARAHELKRERDWVVIYFHDHDGIERQHTVVTENRGSLAGQRVVRGRERECRQWYEQAPVGA